MRLFGKNSTGGGGLKPLAEVSKTTRGGEMQQQTVPGFDVGVVSDCNQKYRRTMEDSHVVILNYMNIPGCAYFAIFDGHAGAQCARALSEHLHVLLAETLKAQSTKDVAQALATSFESMDRKLGSLDIKHSGATAVVAVSCYMREGDFCAPEDSGAERKLFVANAGDSRAVLGVPLSDSVASVGADTDAASDVTVADANGQSPNKLDVRRLSYDHRCSDVHEQKRILNAGGLLINNRVNGMLAVTRSLGDLLMKDYVVGAPYTTESDLKPNGREVLVLACDGLWDVCSDQQALQIAQEVLATGQSAAEASEKLVTHALEQFSVDNLTVMVIAFN